ncbi:MAG: GCN5-related N-acetyltransferase [Pseudomonadota bacterium]
MDRGALERRWLDLTNRDLPGAARADWPVHLNHCFQRILLDHATGGVWYDAIPRRPAYAHAPDAVLREAIALGEAVLNGAVDLRALNRQSLAWRGKRGPRTA